MIDNTDISEMERIQTGVPGLDKILCGGLLPQAVYIVQGGPGEARRSWPTRSVTTAPPVVNARSM